MFRSTLKNLTQRIRGTKTAPIRNDARRARLQFEQLEDRTCPTTVSLVKDIVPGGGGTNLTNFLNVNGTLFFSANDGTIGSELWKSDGTAAGTVLVKDIRPGFGGSNPTNMTNVNGTLYFRAFDVDNGFELWKSDGTAAGTVLVKDINPGVGDSNPFYLTNVNGTLFFRVTDGANGYELWKSDGTAAGTVLVSDINPGAAGSYPTFLTNVNGTLFFAAADADNGTELWKSDGTAAGTVLVNDIRPGPGSTFFSSLTNVNGTLFFIANDSATGYELWKSDGTAAGTVLVRDINPGLSGSIPSSLTNVNGTLFFQARDATNGYELWKSDGTTTGTVLVKDIRPGPGGSSPSNLTNVNGTLFFQARDDTTGYELWKSDGTAAGTVLVKDIRTGANSSSPSNLTNVNGTLFFSAFDLTNGTELWKSDGTATGTVLVKDIKTVGSGSYPSNLTNVNGTLFFRADDGTNGTELWMASTLADDFNRADSTSLGANWAEVGGNFAVDNSQLLAIAATGGNALVNGVSLANVRVTAEVALLTTGSTRVDLFARATNTSNAYVGSLVGTNGVFTARIRKVVGGVSTTLASASVSLTFGEGVLRFEVAGSLLKLFVDDVLVASVLDTKFAAGKVGIGGTQFVSFENFYVSPLDPTVPFGDSFTRNADSTSLGSPWRETAGDLIVRNNQIEAKGTGGNIAVYECGSLADVIVQAQVYATGFGGSAGLVARYLGTGDKNYYLGAITGANGVFTAKIFANVNGTLTQLASAAVGSGTGLLRFEVVGNSLKLFFNGTLVARATDTKLTRAGLAGIRGTPRSTFDTFNADTRTPLLFQEGFNRPDGSDIGPNLLKSGGNFGIATNQLQALNTGTNLAFRDGIKLTNVVLEGVVTVQNTGISDAGLVARAVNSSNYYYAALEGNTGNYQVAIYRVVNNVKTRLGAAAAVGSNTGTLRFEVVGNSLKLFFDGALLVNVTDTKFLAPGLTGLRGTQNTFFDNFAVA